jgi:hypothetical protein
VEGVPDRFSDELYRAHITRYAFEPHTHEAFGIGIIDRGAGRFRYRGVQHLAPGVMASRLRADRNLLQSLLSISPHNGVLSLSGVVDVNRYFIRPECRIDVGPDLCRAAAGA